MNRYNGKERPGKVRSPNGPLGSRWAYPPGIAESGVGPLETIAGLVVFALLAMVGAKAFRGAAYQRETVRVEASAGPIAPMAPAAGGIGIWTRSNVSDRGGSSQNSPGGRE